MSLALDENFSCIYHNVNNIPAKIRADADVPSTGINLNEAATIKLCPTVALDSHDKTHMNNDIHIGICSTIRVPQSKWRLCCAMCNVSAIIQPCFMSNSHTPVQVAIHCIILIRRSWGHIAESTSCGPSHS